MYTRILDSKQCYHIGHRLELKYVFFTHFWRNFHQGLNSLSFVAHAQGRKFQINSDQFQIIGIFKNILDKRVLICKLLLKKEQWLRSRTTSTGRELQISGLAAGKRWLIGGNLPLLGGVSASRSQPASLSLLQQISGLARWPGGCGCDWGGARFGPQACPKEEFAALLLSPPAFGLTQMLWRKGSLLAKRPGEKCAALRL